MEKRKVILMCELNIFSAAKFVGKSVYLRQAVVLVLLKLSYEEEL